MCQNVKNYAKEPKKRERKSSFVGWLKGKLWLGGNEGRLAWRIVVLDEDLRRQGLNTVLLKRNIRNGEKDWKTCHLVFCDKTALDWLNGMC